MVKGVDLVASNLDVLPVDQVESQLDSVGRKRRRENFLLVVTVEIHKVWILSQDKMDQKMVEFEKKVVHILIRQDWNQLHHQHHNHHREQEHHDHIHPWDCPTSIAMVVFHEQTMVGCDDD